MVIDWVCSWVTGSLVGVFGRVLELLLEGFGIRAVVFERGPEFLLAHFGKLLWALAHDLGRQLVMVDSLLVEFGRGLGLSLARLVLR